MKMADSQGLVTPSKNRQSIESSPFIYRQWMTSYASGHTSVIRKFLGHVSVYKFFKLRALRIKTFEVRYLTAKSNALVAHLDQ